MRCVAAFAALTNHRESLPPVTTQWRLFAAAAYAAQNRQLAFQLKMVMTSGASHLNDCDVGRLHFCKLYRPQS